MKVLKGIVSYGCLSWMFCIHSSYAQPMPTENPPAIPPPHTAEQSEWVRSMNSERAIFGINELQWDADLTAAAQAHADKCYFGYPTDQDRNVTVNGNKIIVGSTIAASTVGLPFNPGKAWLEEKSFWNCNENKCQEGKVCGNYTQIVWKNTTKVGCAVKECEKLMNFGQQHLKFSVCFYAPAGNIVGQRPFPVEKCAANNPAPLPPVKP